MTATPLGFPRTVRATGSLPLLAAPTGQGATDRYGHARLPAGARAADPSHVDRITYGRFRNLYLYITNACQLRCEHCYMGERLDEAQRMSLDQSLGTLHYMRKMGSSKLTILGGEPTLHPDYVTIIRAAKAMGYEQVITTSNGLDPAMRKFATMTPDDFAYVQISLDGGSAASHDRIRGAGRFDETLANVERLTAAGFDTRLICTVNNVNVGDALDLLGMADDLGVSLVKYHVFSTIGAGSSHGGQQMAMTPREWIAFYKQLERVADQYRTRVWYQPTFALREDLPRYAEQGYYGCIGRTLDRASIFPDGRMYVCSYLFDTDLFYAQFDDKHLRLNTGDNEFDLFTQPLSKPSCSSCTAGCGGGCPAEQVVMNASACAEDPQVVSVCRLWKADVVTRAVAG